MSTLRKKYTRLRKWDGGYEACLTVGCQTFTVLPVATRKSAEWTRDMLAYAIGEILKREKGRGSHRNALTR